LFIFNLQKYFYSTAIGVSHDSLLTTRGEQ